MSSVNLDKIEAAEVRQPDNVAPNRQQLRQRNDIMADDDYVLSRTGSASERERLGLTEDSFDPGTRHRLAAAGIQPGWRCLEVGAGQGSIARWMAEQVGAHGRVVATDINPRFLTAIDLPNVEVRKHDIRTDPLEPGMYDLAHCRAVLMHLAAPLLAVRRIAAALRVGGWLVVEEPDHSSDRPVNSEHPLAESFTRATRAALERIMAQSPYNPYLGCQTRSLLEQAGLIDVGNEERTRIVRGGEPASRGMLMAFHAYMERGLLSQADFTELQEVYSDTGFSYVMHIGFAAWGKRAG